MVNAHVGTECFDMPPKCDCLVNQHSNSIQTINPYLHSGNKIEIISTSAIAQTTLRFQYAYFSLASTDSKRSCCQSNSHWKPNPRYQQTSTGKLLPSKYKTSASKYCAKWSASMVADIITNYKTSKAMNTLWWPTNRFYCCINVSTVISTRGSYYLKVANQGRLGLLIDAMHDIQGLMLSEIFFVIALIFHLIYGESESLNVKCVLTI